MHGTLYFDGASRGNPGYAAAASVLEWGANQTTTFGEYLGKDKTNNFAEYTALILGLQLALAHNIEHLDVFGDSQLIVKQLKGQYNVRNQSLMPLFCCASQLLRFFKKVSLNFIPRTFNREADRAANEILDRFTPPKHPPSSRSAPRSTVRSNHCSVGET